MVASSHTRPAQPAVSLSCSPSSIRCLPGPTMRPRPTVVAKIPAAFLSPGLQGIVASAHHTAHYNTFLLARSALAPLPPGYPHPIPSQAQRCKRVAAWVASLLARPRRRQCAPRRPSQSSPLLLHPTRPRAEPPSLWGPCMTAVHEDQNVQKAEVQTAAAVRRPRATGSGARVDAIITEEKNARWPQGRARHH